MSKLVEKSPEELGRIIEGLDRQIDSVMAELLRRIGKRTRLDKRLGGERPPGNSRGSDQSPRPKQKG